MGEGRVAGTARGGVGGSRGGRSAAVGLSSAGWHATLSSVADSHTLTNTNTQRGKDYGIVLCPLRYEQMQLRAAGLGDRDSPAIECCGPGRNGVERWFKQNEPHAARAAWMLLVGLAGAIDPVILPGTAHAISTVIERNGKQRRASMVNRSGEQSAVAITSSEELTVTRDARSSLFLATGAQLVDQESVHFAGCAEQLGIRWGIVRGVSDGIETSLPRGLETWVDNEGRTRLGRVLLGLFRAPGDLPHMIALSRDSSWAMHAAASVANRLIKHTDAMNSSR